MSQTFGLTSLRDDQTKPSSTPQLSPQDKENQLLAEVRAEVVQLTRNRDSLKTEVEHLNLSLDATKERQKSDTEVKRLKIQRNILLRQIKELVLALDTLSGRKSGFISAIEDFEKERITDLSSISKAISQELTQFSDSLVTKSQDLGQEESFLSDFAQYYAELAKICEAETSQNALERANLETRLKDTVVQRKSVESAKKLANDSLLRVDRLLRVADERFREADSIGSYFEEIADKERKTLHKAQKEIIMREKAIIAEKKYLVDEKKRLLEIERLIKDKDEALNRKAKELKIVL